LKGKCGQVRVGKVAQLANGKREIEKRNGVKKGGEMGEMYEFMSVIFKELSPEKRT
jgi:hypothetical protein